MIMIQVVIGGITRLTGSGLSITEWKPILGAFPPMNEQAWLDAFNQYKEIAQFKHLNSHFSLSDFKFIFFWEWLHRDSGAGCQVRVRVRDMKCKGANWSGAPVQKCKCERQ